MSADRRAEELARRALDLPSAERAAFLARQCAGEPELRRRVEERLLASAAPPSEPTLLTPAMPAREPALREGPGSRIGPYKLLQQIGEGGFGVVFMADQVEPVRRRVALKVIKLGMDTRRVVARFEAERQALALMDHPHIARVLDAGATDSGRPYFVMELVKGDPITAYADREKLSIQERLTLFLQVCQAVQHAHQKGVIHRDLKPSNVLVTTQDGRPHAKVIDFGIAKATDQQLTEKTLFTELNALIGTPAYMSPEQAAGSLDIDTRSDVYSLGVLLYELLAGSPPFDPARLRSSAQDEILRIIREVDPPRPSTRIATPSTGERGVSASAFPTTRSLEQLAQLRRTEPAKLGTLVRGELDWIVMRAMEKDRARRYATASELADDLARHLAGEPVRAAPPSAAYRLRKLVRRHRGRFAAAGAIALALLASTVLATAAWRRASAERERAQTERERAEAAQRAAEVERSVAVEERRRADLERDAALDARQAAEAAREAAELQRRRAELQERAGRQLTDFVTRLLSLGDLGSEIRPDMSVRELLDYASLQLGEQLSDNPLAEARISATLGQAYLWVGQASTAEALLGRAVELLERSGMATEEELIELVMSQCWAAGSASTENYGRVMLDAWNRLVGSLGRHDPELAQVLEGYEAKGKLDRSEERGFTRTLETARWILERTEARLPRGHPQRRRVADLLCIAADWVAGSSTDPAASQLYEYALGLYVAELGWEDPRSLRCQMLLSGALIDAGEFERAAAFVAARLDALRTKLGPEHELVELFEFRLGECAAARGQHGALRELEERLERMEARHGRASTYWRRNCGHLARAYDGAGAHEHAERLRVALAEVVVEMPRDSRYLDYTLEGLETGRLQQDLHRIGYRREAGSLSAIEANQDVLQTLDTLAMAVEAELESDDPRRILVGRVLTWLADQWEESWGTSFTMTRLGELSLALAAPFAERAPFDLSRALTTLIRHRELRPGGDLELAERMAEEAVELRLRAAGNEWFTGSAESLLGEVLIRRGRYEEARRRLASAYVRMLRGIGAENSNTRIALARMVRACRGDATGVPPAWGHVHALGRVALATILGGTDATATPGPPELWERLESERDDALAMRALLETLRGRAEFAQADPALLAGLARSWSWRYLEAGGALEVALELLDEVRGLAGRQVAAAALELDLLLLATELCEERRAWSLGARTARTGLARAAALGLEQGARAAKLASLSGKFLTELDSLEEAGPMLMTGYESLRVLEGPFGLSTVVALRRLVDWQAARGELERGARLAADLLAEILLRSDASAWLLDELAFYVLAAPQLERELHERAQRASRRALEAAPRTAIHHVTAALAHHRLGEPDAALERLEQANALPGLAGAELAGQRTVLALVLARRGDPAEAQRALREAQQVAEAGTILSHVLLGLLEEARSKLR